MEEEHRGLEEPFSPLFPTIFVYLHTILYSSAGNQKPSLESISTTSKNVSTVSNSPSNR